jgi:hypothetical protein
MSADEVLAMAVSLGLALLFVLLWYLPLARVNRLNASPRWRAALALCPPGCLALLVPVLRSLAAIEVRADGRYVLLFLIMGGAWLLLGWLACALLGVSVRGDAIENANPAAVSHACGALAGAVICFAWANVGEGPTIWTTVGPALLATLALFATALAVELATRPSEAIAIDRDLASGLRQAALLAAAATVLGRAVAGNWESAQGTLRDLVDLGWPALALAAAAIAMNRILRPSPQHPVPPVLGAGLVPGGVLLAGALAWVQSLGPW